MDNYPLLFFIVTFLLAETSGLESGFVTECDSYCDISGYYQTGKLCYSPTVPVYCCGTETTRFCCSEESFSVEHKYTAVDACPKSAWWLFHWQVIIGLLGTIISTLLCTACWYNCCWNLVKNPRSTCNWHQWSDAEPNVQHSDERLHPCSDSSLFNPHSQYAFAPPEYETLPKDPPEYHDIYCSSMSEDRQTQPINEVGNLSEQLLLNEVDDLTEQSPALTQTEAMSFEISR